jgi:SnoaL-like domain
MNDKWTPNLGALDEQGVSQLVSELLTNPDAERAHELRHEDYVMEMPQSGERIRGRQNMREFQEAYPNPPAMRLRRLIFEGHLWIMEGVSDYGGEIYHQIAIVELRDGKIWRETRYYAEPFEAPEWRAQWVERMEEG